MTRKPPVRIRGIVRLVVISALGMILGEFASGCGNPLPLRSRQQVIPAAYRVPKIPGGTALRMAMVHDVIHERYYRHGPAWYEKRNAVARDVIARTPPASPQHLAAVDDLAVGLSQLGRPAEAIPLLEGKLATLQPLPPRPATRPVPLTDRDADERDLTDILNSTDLSPTRHAQYTTLANLGTVRLLASLPGLFDGHPDVPALRQSLDEIERAIEINPGSHFGRERWQAVLIQHLIAAVDHPDLLGKYDFVGDKLDAVDDGKIGSDYLYGRSYTPVGPDPTPQQRLYARRSITRVGAATDWVAAVHPDYRDPMPFDEPVLAIIGMWTAGGGPNPHFALALGQIMGRVGQRQIAWNAYEQAVEMTDHYWPDPAVRARFVAICKDRQYELERYDRSESADARRRRYTAELAWGRQQQAEYHAFEATRLAAGVPPDDPHFDDPFIATHPPIASAPGGADDVVITHTKATDLADQLPCLLLGLGIGAAVAVVIPERIFS